MVDKQDATALADKIEAAIFEYRGPIDGKANAALAKHIAAALQYPVIARNQGAKMISPQITLTILIIIALLIAWNNFI